MSRRSFLCSSDLRICKDLATLWSSDLHMSMSQMEATLWSSGGHPSMHVFCVVLKVPRLFWLSCWIWVGGHRRLLPSLLLLLLAPDADHRLFVCNVGKKCSLKAVCESKGGPEVASAAAAVAAAAAAAARVYRCCHLSP